MIGITGFGVYLPRGRIGLRELRAICPAGVVEAMEARGLRDVAVCQPDEDPVTMSYEACDAALLSANRPPAARIGCLVIGADEPAGPAPAGAATVANLLGLGVRCHVSELAQPGLAGLTSLYLAYCQVRSKAIDLGLAAGVDVRRAARRTGQPALASAAAALVLGRRAPELLATIDAWRFRRDTAPATADRVSTTASRRAPEMAAGGQAAGEPEAEPACVTVVRELFAQHHMRAADFAHAVFTQPGAREPLATGAALGFTERQLRAGLLVGEVGHAPGAGVLLGLAAALDRSEPGERLLVAAGEPAFGAHCFTLTVREPILAARPRTTPVREILSAQRRLSAAEAAQACLGHGSTAR